MKTSPKFTLLTNINTQTFGQQIMHIYLTELKRNKT